MRLTFDGGGGGAGGSGREDRSDRTSRTGKLGPAAASASLAPGSRRASDSSTPIAAIVTSKDDKPWEISGSGTPVIGTRPITAQMLTSACTTIQTVIPAAASLMNGVAIRRATRRPA
jgi:hypothetical protein